MDFAETLCTALEDWNNCPEEKDDRVTGYGGLSQRGIPNGGTHQQRLKFEVG